MQVQREQSQDEIIEALQRQVDELTEANFLLKDQLARKEQFIAMIAHELRGPLTPIISYAQLVARPTRRPETIQRGMRVRSEEHTSELQSRVDLVCRLLLEK